MKSFLKILCKIGLHFWKYIDSPDWGVTMNYKCRICNKKKTTVFGKIKEKDVE